MPIQPRAPTRRENSRSKPPHDLARFTGAAPLNSFLRNSRTSARRLSASGGRSLSAKRDRKSTRLNSSHSQISYAVFCLKKKKKKKIIIKGKIKLLYSTLKLI